MSRDFASVGHHGDYRESLSIAAFSPTFKPVIQISWGFPVPVQKNSGSHRQGRLCYQDLPIAISSPLTWWHRPPCLY